MVVDEIDEGPDCLSEHFRCFCVVSAICANSRVDQLKIPTVGTVHFSECYREIALQFLLSRSWKFCERYPHPVNRVLLTVLNVLVFLRPILRMFRGDLPAL